MDIQIHYYYKETYNKKTLERLPLHSAKIALVSLRRKPCVYITFSSRNWSHVHENILKSHGFYRFLVNRNVELFISFFFKEWFSTLDYGEFSRFLFRDQLYQLEDTKHNAFNLSGFQNHSNHRKLFLMITNYLYSFRK